MLQRSARISLAMSALAATTLLVACSGAKNTAPVIDKLDLPLIAKGNNGAYLVEGTVGYHDDDGTVKFLRVYVPASQPEPIVVTEIKPAETSGEHPLQLTFTGLPAGSRIDYEVSVVDSEGAESEHAKKTVDLP